MTDSTFKTREELEAWAALEGRAANMIAKLKGDDIARHAAVSAIIDRVKAVTLAHSHLLGDKP
jgi:hypothetical protein